MLDNLPGLVELRNLLADKKTIGAAEKQASALYQHVQQMLSLHANYTADELLDLCQQIKDLVYNTRDHMFDLKVRVQQDIDDLIQPTTSESYYNNNLGIDKETRQTWTIQQSAMEELVSEFNAPDLWKFPVACINIQHRGVLDMLIPAGMIYLVDTDPTLLEHALADEDRMVLSRVKSHKLNGWTHMDFSQNITRVRANLRWGLPQSQMSHVVCWNLFQRFTYDVAVKNLSIIRQLLRPGGKVVFSVNDADSVVGAQAVAGNTSSYMTKSLVEKLVQSAEMELLSYRAVEGDNVYMVVAKMPGVLCSLKTHMPRGLIKKS
jgi:ElaB/YqjD/DUF883 family membrane-anchored ribosome-binding protein